MPLWAAGVSYDAEAAAAGRVADSWLQREIWLFVSLWLASLAGAGNFWEEPASLAPKTRGEPRQRQDKSRIFDRRANHTINCPTLIA